MKKIFYSLFLLLFISCSSNKNSNSESSKNEAKKVETEPKQNQSLNNTEWTFVNYNPIDGELKRIQPKPTLTFLGTEKMAIKFSGRCFVNNYGGSMVMKGNELSVSSETYITEMASMNSLLNQKENDYMQQLRNVISFSFNRDSLKLETNSEGGIAKRQMIFVKTNQAK